MYKVMFSFRGTTRLTWVNYLMHTGPVFQRNRVGDIDQLSLSYRISINKGDLYSMPACVARTEPFAKDFA